MHQAVRAQGIGDLDTVDAVVLETDGSFSVITTSSAGSRSALANVAVPAVSPSAIRRLERQIVASTGEQRIRRLLDQVPGAVHVSE